jgi:hypothetical protein
MRATLALVTVIALSTLALCRTGSRSRSPDRPPRALSDAAPAATDATATPAANTCTEDSDCHEGAHHGRCFTPGLAAQYTQAFRDCPEASRWRASHSPGTCIYDQCREETERHPDSCPAGQRCGTLDMNPFPQRVCVTSACTSDSQCRREIGGHCASYLSAGHCIHGGWACSYPHDPCAPRDGERMCPVHPRFVPFCAPRNGRFACVDEPAVAQ